MYGLGRDEAALEIGVNHAGGGRRLVTGANGPRACFLFPGRQVCPQAEQMIHGPDQGADPAAFHSEIAKIFLRLGLAQVHQLALDLGADHHRFRGEMIPRIFLDRAHVSLRAGAGVGDPGR